MSQETSNNYQELFVRVQQVESRLSRVELSLNLTTPAAWATPQPVAPQPVAPQPVAPQPVAPPPPPTAQPPAAYPPVAPPTTAHPPAAYPPAPPPAAAHPAPGEPMAQPQAPQPAQSPASNVASPFPEVTSFAPADAPGPQLPPVSTVPSQPTLPRQQTASAGWNELEQLIGGRWALWLGALCLFLSASSFLAYTWYALSPWMRVALGASGGSTLLVAGALFQSRTQRWFSEGLFGAGLSICFLSAWAAGPYYNLLGFTASSAALVGIAGLGVALAIRYDARSLSILSALGGFLTPVLLRSGTITTAPWTFLSYLALLNTTLLATGTFKNWRELRWLCFSATLLLLNGWVIETQLLSTAMRVPVWMYWTFYWLLFLGAASWPTLARDEEPTENDLLLFFAATSVYAPASWFWLRPALGDYPVIFPLGLAAGFALSATALRIRRPQTTTIRTIASALSLLAITLSFPCQYGTRGLSIFWSLEAGVLLLLASRLRSRLFLNAGQAVLTISVLMLTFDLSLEPTPHILFLNARALPVVIWTAVVALVAWERQRSSFDTEGKAAYPSLAAFAGTFLLAQEITQWFSWTHYPSESSWIAAAVYVIGSVGIGYGLLLWRIARKIHDDALFICALLVGVISLTLTFGGFAFGQTQDWTPVLNLRAAGFALSTALLLWGSWQARRDAPDAQSPAAHITPYLPLAIAMFVLAGVSFELYFGLDHDRPTSYLALSMLWSAASVLFLAWPRPAQREATRLLALVVGCSAVLTLLIGTAMPVPAQLPVLNLRFVAFGFAVGAALWGARQLALDSSETSDMKQLSTTFLFVAWGLMLWMMTQETWQAGEYFQQALGIQWQRWAQMSVSLVWTLIGTLTLVGGVVRNSQPFRLAALSFLAVTAAKVFLFDFSFLTGPLRVLSFGGLGLSLIFISWLYGRFVTPQSPPPTQEP